MPTTLLDSLRTASGFDTANDETGSVLPLRMASQMALETSAEYIQSE